MSTDDIDIDRVTDRVVESLDPGTVIDDKIILNRRQVVALASGAVGVGALGGWASGEAAAEEAAGQVGTSDEPIDVFGNVVDANEVSATVLSGDVVSRPEAIDNLEGNVYLEPEGTDPDTVLEEDGDIVFLHGE